MAKDSRENAGTAAKSDIEHSDCWKKKKIRQRQRDELNDDELDGGEHGASTQHAVNR